MLQGFTVGITADRRWDEQASLFERRGATVVHGPTIRTLPLGSDAPLRDATERVIARPPDVLIANTGLGIRSWFGAADSWDLGGRLLEALAGTRDLRPRPEGVRGRALARPGGGGARAVRATVRSGRPRDRHRSGRARSRCCRSTAPAAPRSSPASRRPAPTWSCCRCTSGACPRTSAPPCASPVGWSAGKVHAVTFTTGPAIRTGWRWLPSTTSTATCAHALTDGSVVVGCVGPVCAEVAEREGIVSEHMVVPAAYRLGPLVRAVADRLVSRQVTIGARQGELVLTGTCVRVGGAVVELSDVEAKLLAVLGRQPNVVIAKAELARQVWADDALDLHVVEVTVARLRRRLGAHGTAITSVHRRGYTLHA